MAFSAYIGVGGKAHKLKNIYIGVNGKARLVTRAYVGVGGKARQWWGIKPGVKSGSIDLYAPYQTSNGYPYYYSWAETKTYVVMIVGAFQWVYYNADNKDSTRYIQYTDSAIFSINKQTGTISEIGSNYWSVGCTNIGAGSLGDGALFVGGDFKSETNTNAANYRRYYNDTLTATEFTKGTVASRNAKILKFANNTAAIVLPYSISSNHVEPMVEIRDTAGTKTYENIFPQGILDNYSATYSGPFADTFRGNQKALIAFNYKSSSAASGTTYDSVGYLMMNQNITYSVIMKGKTLAYGEKVAFTDCLRSLPTSQRGSAKLGDNIICSWASDQPVYSNLATYEPRLYYVLFTPAGTYSFNYFAIAGNHTSTQGTALATVNYPYSICFLNDSYSFTSTFYNKGYMIDMNATFTDFSILTTLYEQSGGFSTRPDQGYNWQYNVRIGYPTFLSTDNGVFMHHTGTRNLFRITGT